MGAIFSFLFGVSGRFRRTEYWLHALVAGVMWAIVGFFGVAYLQQIALTVHQSPAGQKVPPEFWSAMSGVFVFIIVMMWMAISNMVRRFHDFGKSGWNGLWMLVPLVNFYFGFKLAFFRGVDADNAYGPSPYRPQPPKPPKPPRDQVL